MENFNLKLFTKETNIYSRGVYMISHTDTNIKYIGSTINTFSLRWRGHLNGLIRGIGNTALLNIYKKYGLSGFRFTILEEMNDSSEFDIRERERYWIEFYDTYKHGANCTLETHCAFNGDMRKHHYTDEEKFQQMLSSKTKKKTYVYDVDGKLLYVFPSSVACDTFFGLKKGRVNWMVNHPIRSIWGKYYPLYEERDWNPAEEKHKKRCAAARKTAEYRKKTNSYIVKESQKQKIRLSNKKCKGVGLYTLDGTLVKTFISLNQCDDFLKLTRGTTSKVLMGKAKTLQRKYIPKLI